MKQGGVVPPRRRGQRRGLLLIPIDSRSEVIHSGQVSEFFSSEERFAARRWVAYSPASVLGIVPSPKKGIISFVLFVPTSAIRCERRVTE